MITFPRILFPVDFSAQSAATAPAVQAMAQRFGSEVVLLHVIDLPASWHANPEAATTWSGLINPEEFRTEGRAAMDRFVAKQFSGMNVITEQREGDAARQIVDYVREHAIDLVMMPTHGYGSFRRLLLGSVTSKVLHDAPCPVWTGVHAEELRAHPPDRCKRMLCALEAHPRDLSLLKWAAQFACEQQAELRLVHAVAGAEAMFNRESDLSMYEFLFDIARDEIEKLQAEAGTKLDVCLFAGSVGRIVHQAAIGHGADLIIIGRGVIHKPLGGLRTNVYSIIREAPCPVISI